MNNARTNMIQRIMQDAGGYKLISFCRVLNFRKCKPQYSPSIFADYKDGILRIFDRNEHTVVDVKNFKAAILYIRQFNFSTK